VTQKQSRPFAKSVPQIQGGMCHKTPVQLPYWDGKLRAEYGEYQLMEYQCHWGKERFPADGVKQSCSSRPLLFKANKRSCLTSCGYVTRLFRANLYR
jgi:hypothetical protein